MPVPKVGCRTRSPGLKRPPLRARSSSTNPWTSRERRLEPSSGMRDAECGGSGLSPIPHSALRIPYSRGVTEELLGYLRQEAAGPVLLDAAEESTPRGIRHHELFARPCDANVAETALFLHGAVVAVDR